MKKRVLALCVALVLCCAPLWASANSLSPMEEGMYYTWRIPQAGLSVYLPADAGYNVMMDTPESYALQLTYPDVQGSAVVFFAIQNRNLDGKDIATLGEADIQELIRTISDYPELVRWERLDGLLPDQSVMMMTEDREGLIAEHLVALHGPWVINVMTGVMGDSTEIEETASIHQRELLSMALDADILAARVQTYTFPESEVTLTVPESTHMMLLGDEENFKWLVVAQPGTDITALQVYAYWDEAFQGQDVSTLSPALLEELMTHATLQGYDADSVRQEEIEGVHVLAYESSFIDDVPQQHLVGLRDGWGFNVVLPGYDTIDRAWAAEAQQALMRQILTGEGEVPEVQQNEALLPIMVVDDIMGVPLGGRILVVLIPEDFTYRIDWDTDDYRQVVLYETSPISKKIELTFQRDTFADGSSDFVDLSHKEEALASAREYADEISADSGVEVYCDYLADTPWGTPLLMMISADMELALCFTQAEGHMIQIWWLPSETGQVFTIEEIGLFISGIEFI